MQSLPWHQDAALFSAMDIANAQLLLGYLPLVAAIEFGIGDELQNQEVNSVSNYLQKVRFESFVKYDIKSRYLKAGTATHMIREARSVIMT